MKINYETLAFVQAIEMKCGTMTSANNKEFHIEVDTELQMITLIDKGVRKSAVEGDCVQTPMFNMRVGRPIDWSVLIKAGVGPEGFQVGSNQLSQQQTGSLTLSEQSQQTNKTTLSKKK